MQALSESQAEVTAITEEDRMRSAMYDLLARFLNKPPQNEDLEFAAVLEGNETALGKAVAAFGRIASRADTGATTDEYEALFIGVGRGELLPYGSYYLTGFLNEKPLARLRNDMAEHGLEHAPVSTEPEDHAASVCEMMAGLIDGRFGKQLTIEQQKEFFDAHIASWMPEFFRDLEGASASVLYASLAQIGSRFLEIESAAFSMD